MSVARAVPPAVPGVDPVSTDPILTTSRLQLRPMQTDDAADLHEAFGDAETMRFMDRPLSHSLADTERHMAVLTLRLPEWMATWSLVCGETGQVVGFVNYHHREIWNRRLEIGFMLGRRYWGLGLMSEALRAVLDHCFATLNTNRIEVTVNPDNSAAIAMIEHLGFVAEGGPLRERQLVGATYRDLMMYGLLRREWLTR
jgi:ribosomal-protein-alanine N-acetyltransferase